MSKLVEAVLKKWHAGKLRKLEARAKAELEAREKEALRNHKAKPVEYAEKKTHKFLTGKRYRVNNKIFIPQNRAHLKHLKGLSKKYPVYNQDTNIPVEKPARDPNRIAGQGSRLFDHKFMGYMEVYKDHRQALISVTNKGECKMDDLIFKAGSSIWGVCKLWRWLTDNDYEVKASWYGLLPLLAIKNGCKVKKQMIKLPAFRYLRKVALKKQWKVIRKYDEPEGLREYIVKYLEQDSYIAKPKALTQVEKFRQYLAGLELSNGQGVNLAPEEPVIPGHIDNGDITNAWHRWVNSGDYAGIIRAFHTAQEAETVLIGG